MSQDDRPPQTLLATLAALTVVSGLLDAVSYLGLGHVFTANMTGNVVLIGFAAAGAPGFSAVANLTALGTFLAGAVVTGRVALVVPARGTLLVVAMAVEGGLTGGAAIVAATVPTVGTGWPRFTVIALLGFAMGVRNAAVRRAGVPGMSTTVLTTTLTGLASDSRLAGGSNPNAGRRATSVVCLLAGAIAGATLVIHVGPAWPLALASGLVLATATFFALRAPLHGRQAPPLLT